MTFSFETIGLDTAAKRLYRLRFMICSNRQEFSIKHSISSHSLASWETARISITEKTARKFIDIFGKEGVLCSLEWLLYGQGKPPISLKEFTSSLPLGNANRTSNVHTYSSEAEISFFIAHNPLAKIFKMDDDSMEPALYKGDIIGGILTDQRSSKTCLEKPCVIFQENNIYLIRMLTLSTSKNAYNLVALNARVKNINPIERNVCPTEIYKIVWIRRES